MKVDKRYLLYVGIPLFAFVAFRYAPIFKLSRQIRRDADEASHKAKRGIIESTVDQISSDLRVFCLRNGRAPQPIDLTSMINKHRSDHISEVSIENVTYSGAKDCAATLRFTAQGQRFALTVPLPLHQSWSFPSE